VVDNQIDYHTLLRPESLFRVYQTHQTTGENMQVCKQDYDLSLNDLAQFPVWEYALDEEGYEGQDERTVRPYTADPPLEQSYAPESTGKAQPNLS
jgi:hypothetical protein